MSKENNMSEWITDRKPTLDDAMQKTVFAWIDGKCTLAFWDYVSSANLPWQPIPKCEPYVKPKRFVVKRMMDIYSDIESCGYCVYNNIGGVFAKDIPTREAAERIAAIYEDVML